MIHLVHRHLKLFLKDMSNVFLCLLSAIVILGLYALFIRDFMIDAITIMNIELSNVHEFVDSLMSCGLIIVVGCTGALPISCRYVNDKTSGIIDDFYVSPVSRTSIFFSYHVAAFICSLFLSVFTLCIVNGFFIYQYSMIISINRWLFTFLIIFLSAIVSSNLMMLGTLFFKSSHAYSSFANLVGVILGFLAGVYIPIGYYPQTIRNILYYFPLAQTTGMLKLRLVESYIPSHIDANLLDEFYLRFGCTLSYNQSIASLDQQFILVMLSIGLLFILNYLFFQVLDS